MNDLAKSVFRLAIYWVGLWYVLDAYGKVANELLGE